MPEGDNAQTQEAAQQAATTETTPTPEQIQNQIGMAIAFDDKSMMPQTEATAGAAIASTTSNEAGAATTNNDEEVSFDEPIYLKENFGWETREAAIAELQELRNLKQNPPKPEPHKFENEESEKLFTAVTKGDRKELFKILEKQEKIDSLTSIEVNKDNAAEIIKFGIQINNPTLTPTEVDFQYRQEYVAGKEPIQKASETDEEFAERHDEWKEKVEIVETKRVIAAKMAQPQLVAAKSKLVLPLPEITVDPEYETFKVKNANADESYKNVTVPGIKSLKETDVVLGFKVDDPNNQMQFDVVITPTSEDFEKAKQDSLSLNQFLAKTCYDKDGKFLPQNLQKLVLLYNNFGNYAQSIARQAVNKERERIIAKETAGNNGNRDYNANNSEKTELQKNMDFALS